MKTLNHLRFQLPIFVVLFYTIQLQAGRIKSTPIFPMNGQMILAWDPEPIQFMAENCDAEYSVNDLRAYLYYYRDESIVYSERYDLEPSTLTPGQSSTYTVGELPYNALGLGHFNLIVEVYSPDNIETMLNTFSVDITISEECLSDPTITTIIPPNNGCLERNQSGNIQVMLTNIGTCVTEDLKLQVEFPWDTSITIVDYQISELEPASTRTESIPIFADDFISGIVHEIKISVFASNDGNPDNNQKSTTITIKPPVFDARINSISAPECTHYDSPFNVDVSIENAGNASIDQLSVDLQFINMTHPGAGFNVSGSFLDLSTSNTIDLSFPIDQHLNQVNLSGQYEIIGTVMIEDDANPDDNTQKTSAKIALTRPAIVDIALDKLAVPEDNPFAMSHLSEKPFPEGTVFRPLGKPTAAYTAEVPVYMGFLDTDELANLEHPFHYCFYNEFGQVEGILETGTPLLIDGQLEDYDPFINEFYIDGTPVEGEIEGTPEDFINNDASASGPTVDSVACVILVSGEKQEYTDVAFENDINLMEEQLMTEKKGHMFRQDQFIKLSRPTPEQLDSVLNVIKDADVPNKTIYFIYTGHGELENGGSIILQSPDLDSEYSNYSYARLAKGLKETGASTFRVIIDACYSGLAVDKFSDEFLISSKNNQRLSLFTSCKDSVTASSVGLKVDGMRRYFSQYLFRWMQGYGSYDPNMDGLSSFEECHLFSTFNPSFRSETRDNIPDQTLWREQEPWSYKNGNELLDEDDVKTRLGDTKINVIRRIQGFKRKNNRSIDDAIIQYSEIIGLPENTSLGPGVEEVVDYRHWILNLESSDDSSSFDLFIQPEIDLEIEHDIEDGRNLGLVQLNGDVWKSIVTSYNPENGEVIIKDFDAFGIIALAYTDRSSTTSIEQDEIVRVPIMVYPNPSVDVFTVDFQDIAPGNYIIEVYGLLGQRVLVQQAFARNSLSIKAKDWSPGIYTLILRSNGQIIGNKKMIKR